MTATATRLSPLTALAAATLLAAAPASDAKPVNAPPSLERHVQSVAAAVSPHLARLGARPAVRVVELSPAVAGKSSGGVLEVSTGLLSALSSDAELAMILAYEMARTPPSAPVPARRAGFGSRLARAVVTGAAVGVVASEVNDALRGSGDVVRAAGSGGAVYATSTLMSEAWNRRGTRRHAGADDAAAAEAARAVAAAGFDTRTALGAWDALSRRGDASLRDGGLSDARANARRRRSASRALRRVPPVAGSTIGAQSYSAAKTAGLDGWRVARAQPAADTEAAVMKTSHPIAADEAWLVYRRSGGITGWSASLELFADGTMVATRSEERDAPRRRLPLEKEELAEIDAAVEAALDAPTPKPLPELRYLRDGIRRRLVLSEAGSQRARELSDGFSLSEADRELTRRLEALLRRK